MENTYIFTKGLLFLLHLMIWNDGNCTLATQECGLMVNNSLKSPGYPTNYPNNMDCIYRVPIPHGMAMNISFNFFDVETHSSCGWDYLSISSAYNHTFAVYCGQRTGRTVLITGEYAVIAFHSDSVFAKTGFLLFFTAVPVGRSLLSNNSLKSPGYPNTYPNNLDLFHSVPIPPDMVMNIYFENFDVQDGGQFCRLDYLSVWNENYQIFGKYCGQETGRTVTVTGEYAVIKFHSDDSGQTRGFLLSFSASLPVPPKVIIPAAVVRTVPGYKLTLPVTGSSPIYTAIIRNCTVLVNTTNTASILVDHEGNYTCVASSSYGSDLKKFSVIFNDCGPQCSHRWNKYFGNTLTCKNASSAKDILNCFPMMTDEMYLSENGITFLQDGVFAHLKTLKYL
ncbi:procollagen C-endopeptidase enhancer 1-like [Oculina patagonica]